MLDMPDSIAKIYKDVPEINEIDNRGFPICRPLFSHSSLPFNFELEQVDVNKYDSGEFVYCVYVHHNQKLWVEHIDLIPKKVLDLVRHGKGYLLFDNTLEGNRIDEEWFITPFYENIEKLNLPFDKVVFVTNNLIGEETHNNWFESQNHYKDKIKLILAISYAIIVSGFLWAFFANFSLSEITSYDFIKENRNYLNQFKSNNYLLSITLFFIFTTLLPIFLIFLFFIKRCASLAITLSNIFFLT